MQDMDSKSQSLGVQVFPIGTSHSARAIAPSYLGRGAFESFLVRKVNGQFLISELHAHLNRLSVGATFFNIPIAPPAQLIEELRYCIQKAAWLDALVAKVRVVIQPEQQYVLFEPMSIDSGIPQPVSLKSIVTQREFPEIKSCSAAVSWWSSNAAQSQGFDEALLVDGSNIVRECSWSNFFWFDDKGRLNTTDAHILKGVTRGVVLKGAASRFECIVRDCTLSELSSSVEEAFITSAFRGIVPVHTIDDMKLAIDIRGDRTKELGEYYAQHAEVTRL